ncbi:dehydrogenase [Acrocarpospora pleiomorpha]|uniref:Dehydrogenase n=1 Tax=Acrocarpospora pleiomorpha TaxID=90975 RepID=A0A5M3XZ62_9ACTN|nr:NAD(P)-dependent oxidoreductase [Acrocarpospora pleiomorpha]GES26310.1 dehydrogenase [Acrocarpospora pleiomorpha]
MPFRIGLTRDFLDPDGKVGWGDIGLAALDEADGVAWDFIDVVSGDIPPEAVRGYDALIVLTPRVTEDTLKGADRLALVARFGVGYDNVDVETCTRHGVVVTITPDGVRVPVAVSALTLLLAAAHRLREKDALVRTGRWEDKLAYMGTGLTGRALGLVGWGNIGREVSRVCAPLGLRQLAADPFADRDAAEAAGVTLVELDTLLAEADFVVVTCALTPQTRHLLNASRLATMKPSAFLVNVARGPIVDQAALTEALTARRIAGAALDVFEVEPPDPADPLLALDNVLLTPHAVAWTDELALGNGRGAIQAALDVAAGRAPAHPVNPAALDHPLFLSRKASR